MLDQVPSAAEERLIAVVSDWYNTQGPSSRVSASRTYADFFHQGLNTGTSVRLTGKLVESTGKGQEKELRVDEVEIWESVILR